MTITIHTDDGVDRDTGAGWAVLGGDGNPVAPAVEQHHLGLAKMRAKTRQAILAAAETHELEFLERLQKRVDEHGPDGVVVRNEFDACLLAVLIDVLRESREVRL